MGDRANIVVKDDYHEGAVFLYSHWGGYELPETLRLALAKHWRWDDGPYLTRIIFNQMTEGQEGNETGFGISTGICDNSYDLLVCYNQSVYVLPEVTYRASGLATDMCPSISFEDYISWERNWDNITDTVRD